MSATQETSQTIEIWEISRLIPYEKNAKIHDEENVEKICQSIRQYGFNSPIQVMASGVIVCGHGRRLAAMKLGMTHVPVKVLHHITNETEADAYRLVDNQVSNGKIDVDILGEEIRRLTREADYDLTGFFSANEMKFALDDVGEINLEAITDDLSAEVDSFSERTGKKLEADKDRKVPIGEALGFREVTVPQKRKLGHLSAVLKAQYPEKSPLEAFFTMLDEYLNRAESMA